MRELKFRAWNKIMRQYRHFVLQKGVNVSIRADLEIEQYTGLKDKNGKEIYEGDIVKLWDIEPELVVWDNLIGAYDPLSWGWFDTDECEIIGNIHENPELLGDTNDINMEGE